MNAKHTTSSKKTTTSKKTLDIQHSHHLKVISDNRKSIESMQARIAEFTEAIAALALKRQSGSATEDDVDEYIRILDEKLDVEAKMSTLESKADEVAYYTKTADILFKYYDLLEKGHVDDANTKPSAVVPITNNNSILKYLTAGHKPRTAQEHVKAQAAAHAQTQQTKHVSANIQDQSRGTLLEMYMSQTDPDFVNMSRCKELEDRCKHCGSLHMTTMTNDGYMFCKDCNTMEYVIIDHDKPSYRDPPKEISYFAYKRINHFREWSGFCNLLSFNMLQTFDVIKIIGRLFAYKNLIVI